MVWWKMQKLPERTTGLPIAVTRGAAESLLRG